MTQRVRVYREQPTGISERYAPEIVCAAVPGDPRNIKVTTLDDLPLAEALATHFDNGRWTDR